MPPATQKSEAEAATRRQPGTHSFPDGCGATLARRSPTPRESPPAAIDPRSRRSRLGPGVGRRRRPAGRPAALTPNYTSEKDQKPPASRA